MTDKIIEAARAAGWYDLQIEMASPAERDRLARFYAIAHQQGMEHLASEAIDTVARHGGSVEIEAAIRALPSQQDHSADANKMVDRHTLQAEGKHPAPCARFCEANAFRIEERQQARLIAELEAQVRALSRDAERMDYLQRHARSDPKMDGNHVWWPTSFNQAQNLKGPTLREAIDAAIAAQKDGQAKGEPK